MHKAQDTVSIEFVRGMLSGVGYPHADCRQWLDDAGIDPALLAQTSSRVSADRYVALFVLLMERLDDEFLGFLSRPFKRGSFGVVVQSTFGASTLGHALHRLSKTLRLLQDDIELTHAEDGPLVGLRLVFKSQHLSAHTFLHELVLRVFWRLIAWLHGGRLKAARFDFAFATPSYSHEYAKVFPGSVRFDQANTTVWFDAGSLDVKLLHDAPAYRHFLAMSPRNVIVPERSDRALSTQVRRHLQDAIPNWPDLVSTAEALQTSVSTLQRHLAAEGASFQAVKDQLRLDIAIARLDAGKTSLTTLARQLGFADSPAFQRAFKGWTGSPAGAYRRRAARR